MVSNIIQTFIDQMRSLMMNIKALQILDVETKESIMY